MVENTELSSSLFSVGLGLTGPEPAFLLIFWLKCRVFQTQSADPSEADRLWTQLP